MNKSYSKIYFNLPNGFLEYKNGVRRVLQKIWIIWEKIEKNYFHIKSYWVSQRTLAKLIKKIKDKDF